MIILFLIIPNNQKSTTVSRLAYLRNNFQIPPYKFTIHPIYYNQRNCSIFTICTMEKPILNLIKKQTKTITNLTAGIDPSFSICNNKIIRQRLQNQISRRYSLNPALRLATFVDFKGFQNYLLQKIPSSIVNENNYFLNSKVLPSLIPQKSKISVFVPKLFNTALKITSSQNITFSSPFKTYEGIQQAANLNIKSMIVNTPDQIQKIQMTNHKFKYIWQFDEIDLKEAEIIFKLLAKQSLFLNGVRFKDIPVNLLNDVQKCIQLGKKFKHNLLTNTIQIKMNDNNYFSGWKKSSKSSLNTLINDLDTSSFVICAAKVIGKNREGPIHNDGIEQILPNINNRGQIEVHSKQWTIFSPKNMIGLQQFSDEIIQQDLGTN